MNISSNYAVTPNNNRYQINNKPVFGRAIAEHMSWGARYIKKTGKTNFKLFTFPDVKDVRVVVAKAGKGIVEVKDSFWKMLAGLGAAAGIGTAVKNTENADIYPMKRTGNCTYIAEGLPVKPDTEYGYAIQNAKGDWVIVKDPYSMQQKDVNGLSQVYNPGNYEWKATDWIEGKDPRRITRDVNDTRFGGTRDLVIEECCIPTLSNEGDFEHAKAYIDRISERGIANAVEFLPVENTHSLQWGYDGVDKFAINEKMGGAVKFKELVDYVHSKGLNVIADLVPNHIGPDGNYLAITGPYEGGSSDFGALLNYEGYNNQEVRDYIVNQALYYANEFKVDGIRFDMTKYCNSDWTLKQIVEELAYHNPKVFTVFEDGRNNYDKVTKQSYWDAKHEDKIRDIDRQINGKMDGQAPTDPIGIGATDQWDFPGMHALKSSIIGPFVDLNSIDSNYKNIGHLVSYVMSHDEIGNWDGTRLGAKCMTELLGLFGRINGYSAAEVGQRAALLGQKLFELSASGDLDKMSQQEINEVTKKYYLDPAKQVHKNDIVRAFNMAKAKEKLAHGAIFTKPGAKMYFQGDDSLEVARFPFFRMTTDREYAKKHDQTRYQQMLASDMHDKGYITNEEIARPEAIVGKLPVAKEHAENILKFTQDIAKLSRTNPALREGYLVGTYCDYYNNVHMHQLKCGNDEVLVIKNFGSDKFYDNNYGYAGFPEGNWKEIFNSDSAKYGGSDYVNKERGNTIYYGNQNLNLAPNSIIILQKV